MRQFRDTDKLSRTHDILSTELDQETVLMSIKAGAYYGLEGSAQRIWENLASPMTFSALVNRLVEEYQVAPEVCVSDLQVFLDKMEQEGLLHVE